MIFSFVRDRDTTDIKRSAPARVCFARVELLTQGPGEAVPAGAQLLQVRRVPAHAAVVTGRGGARVVHITRRTCKYEVE